MDANDRKARLEALRAELLERIQLYEAHQRRMTGALDKDMEEQAQEIENDEVVDLLDDEAREELDQIDKALARITANVGDRCEICGETIAPGRLVALPYTTRCVDCAIE
ncbi:TraR/DksA family transcriptional regulator [Litchfieldella anticariensis]|uniref:TraR/DksA family transcriptional regulator n=1 Tax=Litchfieldella anticariensis TaxID=258591 RepID=UPI0009DB9241|nr:TraR/DksA family transcriptional regulator [Halomonas anticariensis]